MKQTELQFTRKNTIKYHVEKKKMFGGSLTYRKCKRPLDSKKAIHIIFKLNPKLTLSLRKDLNEINKKLLVYTKRFDLKLYKHAVNSNHIHIICQAPDTSNVAKFLRAFSGSTALFLNRKYNLKLKLWQHRPFTRLVSWGREFKAVSQYILKNFKEVVGFVAYAPRKNGTYKFLVSYG